MLAGPDVSAKQYCTGSPSQGGAARERVRDVSQTVRGSMVGLAL